MFTSPSLHCKKFVKKIQMREGKISFTLRAEIEHVGFPQALLAFLDERFESRIVSYLGAARRGMG
jgi:hypothetical protein